MSGSFAYVAKPSSFMSRAITAELLSFAPPPALGSDHSVCQEGGGEGVQRSAAGLSHYPRLQTPGIAKN